MENWQKSHTVFTYLTAAYLISLTISLVSFPTFGPFFFLIIII